MKMMVNLIVEADRVYEMRLASPASIDTDDHQFRRLQIDEALLSFVGIWREAATTANWCEKRTRRDQRGSRAPIATGLVLLSPLRRHVSEDRRAAPGHPGDRHPPTGTPEGAAPGRPQYSSY
jgi:hypothetical protein